MTATLSYVLDEARAVVELCQQIIDRALVEVRESAGADPDPARTPGGQAIAYDLAQAAATMTLARSAITYGQHGDLENAIASAFVADAAHDLLGRIAGRERQWFATVDELGPILPFIATHRDPVSLSALATQPGPRHLDPDLEMVQDTFRRFADDKVRPVAEHVHRTNCDLPEQIVTGLAELGTFGLSVPEADGGYSPGGAQEYLAMVVATEELSRASLGIAGSLITRPEILTRALVQGGTAEQRQTWLPRVANGEVMVAIAVTEPDHGSDSAAITTRATPVAGGWEISGVKTWCTFAGRADLLMLLARTNPDSSEGHRGLSMFLVSKPRAEGHHFSFTQDAGGRMEGRAIDTIGYRGMHSYEVAFDRWFVTDDHLVGGTTGIGRGFYLQMQGFENGRLQTAARAVGVMQAAYDAALDYASQRSVFARPLIDFELTRVKLGRMAATIQIVRQATYDIARLLAEGTGTIEAAMVKAYACRAAEWITREAQQIHGGMGYAEEFPVSRLFLDARVLSIFEGSDEILALSVITKHLLRRLPSGTNQTGTESTQ